MSETRKQDLTARQAGVLRFIQRYIEREQFPPTVGEIMREFGFRSPNSVVCHLKALEEKGWIERVKGSPRAIRVL